VEGTRRALILTKQSPFVLAQAKLHVTLSSGESMKQNDRLIQTEWCFNQITAHLSSPFS